MSGMAACYSWNTPVDRDLMARMQQTMSHRGEVSWSWVECSVGLARRDWHSSTPSAPAPFLGQEETYPVAADARLDYRADLLKRLGASPLVLPNISDAQLIAAAYTHWGEACVNELEGDFAFVLWDSKRSRLFGARSVVGLRPFMYHVTPQRFLCASEPRQLLEDPAVSRELNPTWVAFWLTSGQGHWDGTIYQDMQVLLPGHCVCVDATGIQIKPFWHPPTRTSSQGNAAEQVRQLLTDAVQTRLCDQRRLYFDLSGGLDSSSLVSLAGSLWEQEKKCYPLDCFHAVSEKSFAYAQAVALQYPMTRLHTISFQEHLHFDGAFEPAPSWMALPCRPTVVLTSFYEQQWSIAGQLGAQAHIRGDFGDELLSPSLNYLWTYWKEHHLFTLAREVQRWHQRGVLSPRALFEQGVLLPQRQARLHHHTSSPPWIRLTMGALGRERTQQDERYFCRICPDPFVREIVRWMYFHVDYTIQADVALRMAGLETREPYTDLRLIEFLLATPPQDQMRPLQRKFLLREAMEGILPELVRQRKGKGHAYRLYFQGIKKHREQLRQAVLGIPEMLTPYIDQAPLLAAIDGVALGGQAQVPALSSALALILWSHRLPWA